MNARSSAHRPAAAQRLSVLISAILAGGAYAGDIKSALHTFDIPAESTGEALNDFAKQSGLRLLFSYDAVEGLRGDAIKGKLSSARALDELLTGTGLHYEVTSDDVIVIKAPAAKTSAAVPAAEAQDVNKDVNKDANSQSRAVLAEATPNTAAKTENASLAETAAEGNNVLAEIIVTAQKRSERLIDTPQSISVLSGGDLAKMGAVQFRDFATTVPGLTLSTAGAGFNQITLRGVTTGVNLSSTVGIYVDDVAFGSSTSFAHGSMLGLDVGLFDIDRVEVLRGPQGTLYGASTMGGLIKYVTKRPDTNAFAGESQVGVSSTQHGGVNYNVAAAVNLPLAADRAAVRISGYESHDGGFIDNVALNRSDVNRSDIYGGRIDLLLKPVEDLSIRIVGFAQNIARDGQATADYTFAGAQPYGALDQHREFSEPFDQHFRLVSSTVAYDFGPASLTSISSYQTTTTDNFYDLSAFYVPAFGGLFSAVGDPAIDTTNKFTQEVRLSSAAGAPVEWLAGVFYTRESSRDKQSFALLDPARQPVANTLFTVNDPSLFREYAGFADLTYHLTVKFDVSGGLRYAKNNQEYKQNGSGAFGVSLPNRRSSDGVFTYLGNARYHFSDESTAYVRYATGYRPGGPNAVANDPATGQPTAPPAYHADRLKSYEAGFKSQSPDHRFEMDIDAYYINWNDIQIFRNVHGFSFNGNAGRATVRGSELTLTALPCAGLRLSGAFAYQDAKLEDASTDLGAAKGERLPTVPRFTAALNSDYDILSAGLRPTVGATLRYVTDRTASFDASIGNPQYRLPAYAVLDLRTGLTLGSVNAQLYVHNLFDRVGELSANTPYGTAQVAIIQPRTVGLALSASF